MKRIIRKLTILVFLVTAGFLIADRNPTSYAMTSCWEIAFDRWNTCDNAYSNTVSNHTMINNYCDTNTASNCSATAHSYCDAQANSACSSSPTPQTCYNQSYNNCYMSQYQSCHTTTQQQCYDNVNNAYDNRGNAYASCMGFEGNGGNCIEQMDQCDIARQRRDQCNLSYNQDPDYYDGYYTCLANSGIWQCE